MIHFIRLAYIVVKETFRMNNNSSAAVRFSSSTCPPANLDRGAQASIFLILYQIEPRSQEKGSRNEGASHVTSLCPVLFHLYAFKQRINELIKQK